VHDVCVALQTKIAELVTTRPGSVLQNEKPEDLHFAKGIIALKTDASKRVAYADVLKQTDVSELEVTKDSQAGDERDKYSIYSFAIHFVQVLVHRSTGVVRIKKVVTVADAGKIINEKTAASQLVGGVVSGIGMVLMEDAVLDHRFGRYVNNNLADYHVPVSADVPQIEALFIDKPDPVINPMGSKGLGEIANVGFAAAVANAVYHATGKRIRALPITPDKLLG
jgi:xanthine dehydrogenase YagR molybdenum-binding subunit